MFKLIISYCLVVLCISGSLAVKAPSYIKICPGRKPDCLKKTVQETLPLFAMGIPELGVGAIDPLTQDYVTVTLPGDFKVELNNGNMTGLKKCRIDSVSFSNNEADLQMHCDLTIKGQYKAHGRILIVTIDGDGNAKIKIKNAMLRAKIRFTDVVRDGVTYYEVKDFDTQFTYGDKVTFHLTNLFKGSNELKEFTNIQMTDTRPAYSVQSFVDDVEVYTTHGAVENGEAVLNFLNQNWKQVAEEFGKPLVDKLVDIVYNIVKKFFEAVPKDELFVD